MVGRRRPGAIRAFHSGSIASPEMRSSCQSKKAGVPHAAASFFSPDRDLGRPASGVEAWRRATSGSTPINTAPLPVPRTPLRGMTLSGGSDVPTARKQPSVTLSNAGAREFAPCPVWPRGGVTSCGPQCSISGTNREHLFLFQAQGGNFTIRKSAGHPAAPDGLGPGFCRARVRPSFRSSLRIKAGAPSGRPVRSAPYGRKIIAAGALTANHLPVKLGTPFC